MDVTLESVEQVWGDDVRTGEPNTPLVCVRGRDPRGEQLVLTASLAEFTAAVSGFEADYRVSAVEASRAVAISLLLALVSESPAAGEHRPRSVEE